MLNASLALRLLALGVISARAQYTATYLPWNAPDKTEAGQTGTNKCGTESSQSSMCQNLYVNSADDFCLWAPPNPGSGSTIGDTEQIEVAWCTTPGYGTRLIPDGTLKGVHFVETPDYVQLTGVGDFTKMNVPRGDSGGELDPHGADGNGNPHGGLVFSSAFGSLQQVHEWTNFMSDSEFCIRVCKDGNTARAKALCQHIYDTMGCFWNMPGDYDSGVFENCEGDSGEPMGVYGTSTFHQGDPATPPAHPAPKSSDCVRIASVSNGNAPATFTTKAASSTTQSTSSATSTAVSSLTNSTSSTTSSSSIVSSALTNTTVSQSTTTFNSTTSAFLSTSTTVVSVDGTPTTSTFTVTFTPTPTPSPSIRPVAPPESSGAALSSYHLESGAFAAMIAGLLAFLM